MRCIIDTNVLISAALFPGSTPAKAYFKAVMAPHVAIVCDYSIDELRRVFNNKFEDKLHILDSFLAFLLRSVEVVDTPPEEDASDSELLIRDINDRPILRSALHSNADLLITGDKDFLESGLTSPQIVTSAEFLNI